MPLHEEPSEDSFCHNCSKVGKTWRCSKCKRVRYCSRECQKSHWKGHKKTCGMSVADAMLQLHKLCGDMNLSESIEQYHRATDEVHSQCKMQSELYSTEIRSHNTVPNPTIHTNKDLKESCSSSSSSSKVRKDTPKPQIVSKGEWNFSVEHLSYISTYFIMLVPTSTSSGLPLDEIKINLTQLQQKTKVTIYSDTNHSCLAEFMLPKFLSSTRDDIYKTLQSHQDQNISFRIRYDDSLNDTMDVMSMDVSYTSTPNSVINRLQCKSCETNLVRSFNKEDDPSQIIKHVYPLPSGHWDEITDYLTCFEGQATVDFSSIHTTAKKGIAFEDEVTLVMNMEDLTNVCVLAVDGLGEQESSMFHPNVQDEKESNPVQDLAKDHISYRGEREWKDSVGGATLCCSICCSNIGNVSLTEGSTCRLYKHRLSSCSPEGKDHVSPNTCGAFVAKELVRYLENQAIFTFAIYGRMDGNSDDTYDCIVLKVLSWNTMMAVKEVKELLQFQKCVKVLYEVIDLNKMPKEQNKATGLDPMSFSWGGVDLCCPPNQTTFHTMNSVQGDDQISSSSVTKGDTEAEKASVTMYLYGEDWLDLKQCLEKGSIFFSKEMSATTAALKFGRNEATDSNATLSFLQF